MIRLQILVLSSPYPISSSISCGVRAEHWTVVSKSPAKVAVPVFRRTQRCACVPGPFITTVSQLHASNSTCVRGDARHGPDVGTVSSDVTGIYHIVVFGYDIYEAGFDDLWTMPLD